MKKLKRYDRGEIRSAFFTDEGFLIADAVVTRTGIFNYANEDGSLRRELRHPDDVFLQSSLDSMKMIPVTMLHPQEKEVTAANAKQLQVGMMGENINPDGRFVVARVKVTDGESIEQVLSGVQELSLGYTLTLDETPGEYDGQRYDCRQKEINYNHLAIVPQARAGKQARIKLDGKDAIQQRADGMVEASAKILVSHEKETSKPKTWDEKRPYPDDDHVHTYLIDEHGNGVTSADGKVSHIHNIYDFVVGWNEGHLHELKDVPKLDSKQDANPQQKRSDNMNLVKFNVDGLPYDAAPEVVNFAKKEAKRANDAETALKTANDATTALQAKFDAQEDELKKLKAVDNAGEIQKAVDARFQLIAEALPHLDEETQKKVSTMDANDIRLSVIKAASPDFNADSIPEENREVYISARYDAAKESLAQNSDGMSRQRQQINNSNQDGSQNTGEPDSDKSRADMINRHAEAWTKPIGVTAAAQ